MSFMSFMLPVLKRLGTQPTAATRFLILLLAADIVFILLQIPYRAGMMSNPFFSIETDMGYPEVYQYIKEFWIILLLMEILLDRPKVIYFAWLCLFTYILCDDMLTIHETAGRWLATQLNLQPMFGLRAKDFGELIVSAGAGSVLLGSIVLAYFFTESREKAISRHLAGLFVLLVGFGIGVDMIHQLMPFGKNILGVVEDGGEMCVVSLMVWYLFKTCPRPPGTPGIPHDPAAWVSKSRGK